jgi:hypothetical protein
MEREVSKFLTLGAELFYQTAADNSAIVAGQWSCHPYGLYSIRPLQLPNAKALVPFPQKCPSRWEGYKGRFS